jgi:hypothetical protein
MSAWKLSEGRACHRAESPGTRDEGPGRVSKATLEPANAHVAEHGQHPVGACCIPPTIWSHPDA